MMRCKGNFSTCDICNAANAFLTDGSRRYTTSQRELILKWRRLHLKQQAAERLDLERRRQEALYVDPHTHQPTKAFMFGDAMTHRR